jgi:sugar-specific transcriptional regulator TrmB
MIIFLMNDKEIFKELGLTFNEGKVYSELIRHGKLSASEISSKSEVPYGKIYVVLQRLIDKGLIEIVPEKTKKYVSSNPSSLMKLVDNKRKLLDDAEKRVEKMKQFYEKKDKDFLIVGEGERSFWKIADEMKKVETYGYNVRWDSKVNPDSLKKTKKRIKEGVDTRDLSRYDKETKSNVDKWMKVKPQIRKFPNEGVALSISDDEEVLIGLIKKNTTLLIRDSAFAKVMKRLFLGAYKNAEKINPKS